MSDRYEGPEEESPALRRPKPYQVRAEDVTDPGDLNAWLQRNPVPNTYFGPSYDRRGQPVYGDPGDLSEWIHNNPGLFQGDYREQKPQSDEVYTDPMGQQRPRPGTERPIQNPDGSVTTERSITVTEPGLNGGRATNIPTVWDGRVVSDDEAVQNAIASGMQFPSFDSIEKAVSSAEQRSRDLGSGAATSVGGASVPPEVQNALPNRNRAVRSEPIYEGPQSQELDEIHQGIMEYQQHQQMSPDERRSQWIEQNIWRQGLTVDMGTGEIIDPETGQAVGQIPNFQ